jgi:hypothetical protein
LDYATQFLTTLQAELPDIDQSPDELIAMPQDERNGILKIRQRIIRALCDKIDIWADGRIKLYGVLGHTEAWEFELERSWTRRWGACWHRSRCGRLPDGTVLVDWTGVSIRIPDEAVEQANSELDFWEVIPD